MAIDKTMLHRECSGKIQTFIHISANRISGGSITRNKQLVWVRERPGTVMRSIHTHSVGWLTRAWEPLSLTHVAVFSGIVVIERDSHSCYLMFLARSNYDLSASVFGDLCACQMVVVGRRCYEWETENSRKYTDTSIWRQLPPPLLVLNPRQLRYGY